jgi:hypothetical protein
VVIRDVTGKEVSIAKSQLQVMEKVPGSLMPPGLTAGLDETEFVNLVGFLTKLGEPGNFRVPNTRFVRRWETTANSSGVTGKVPKNARVLWQPVYSKVSGELPVNELPEITSNGKQFSVARFDVEVLTKGNVAFALNAPAGITATADAKPLKMSDGTLIADLPQGIHSITLLVDRSVVKQPGLKVELKDAAGGAQTRLRMGR